MKRNESHVNVSRHDASVKSMKPFDDDIISGNSNNKYTSRENGDFLFFGKTTKQTVPLKESFRLNLPMERVDCFQMVSNFPHRFFSIHSILLLML
jgi:hypothetical protein